MKILITGIAGFAGSHLAEYIIEKHPDVEVFGLHKKESDLINIKSIKDKITLTSCDITNKEEVFRCVKEVQADRIFHLAAQSYVSSSWENPEKTYETNVIGQSNILEGVRNIKGYDPTIVITGSSEEYGMPSRDIIPIKEDAPLEPLSPYALSKIAQDYMGYQYFKTYGMKVIRLRAFNHTGPRRDSVFGVSHFCKKIAEIENGKSAPEIAVRDLTAVRDFTDVRDMVRGYFLASDKCEPGEVYNICSNKGVSFQQILDRLLELSKVKDIQIKKDPKGPRPTDGGTVIGDNTKFVEKTGWSIENDFFEKTIPDLLEYWRENV